MRITIPVSGDGEAWMAHMPEIEFDPVDLLDEKGKLIMPKVVRLFDRANEFCRSSGFRQMFMSSSGDGFNVYSMTIEFLRQLSSVTHWLESKKDCPAHCASDGSASDRRLQRRMARDQVAFCRIDVRDVSTGIKFVVGYDNPNEFVIGNCGNGAREFALYATRILLNMADRINAMGADRNSGLRVDIEGRDFLLVEDARRREIVGRELDKVREENAKRATCPNNVGGFCSPACPDCRCYRNGNCVEASLPDVLK